jgi:hypothetical protein
MLWETVIGLETHVQMLDVAHQYQTVTDRRQSVPDA